MNHITHSPPSEAVGQSESFLKFQEQLSLAARADRSVLIIGERGTGKELAAAKLHYLSRRWDGPFIPLNCAALAQPLLDSELFGHEAGAFTGAAARRKGRFEAADNGTLFLDEIANLSKEAQEKILRAVEYGVFERVGGVAPVSVNVRVVGATNEDLPSLAGDGKFKRDLLDRISFEVLTLPPLREREGDIELLAYHFAGRMAVEMGFSGVPDFSEQAINSLLSHSWPGNVRELKNVVERAVYRSDGDLVDDIVLDPFESPFRPASPKAPQDKPAPREPARTGADLGTPLREALCALEKAYLDQALAKTKHNQRRAADLLGMTYHQFRGLYRKHSATDTK
ncbi:phage shock protein operon transcriptional activator [Salidesulfovibrio onnuriiensis]|uniref:phage shock protein operon transcriptional activator n=1 Tax=Salidesulfovibrio onnuriiensis TaxID=2583823 RepID=UPI0011C831C1|nr:phage shock protein operon transcriptional activator [Salidesulfovibrio onnuriiensis]